MAKAQIVIISGRFRGGISKKTNRRLTGWELRYDDDDGGFFTWGNFGGMAQARRYAKKLKAKLTTDPVIIEKKGV